MTLIEFFSDSHVDNIAACLRLQPQKLIIVGNADEMDTSLRRYEKLLKQRGQHTAVTGCDVRGKDFDQICTMLEQLIPAEEECVIDLTGGDDCVVMALGAVYARLDPQLRQRIRLERFDRKTDAPVDCLQGNRKISCKPIKLTVEELIALHGGILYPNSYQPPMDCTHRDLASLWNVVSDAPKNWNSSIGTLREFESHSSSGTQVELSLEDLRREISDFQRKESIVRNLLDQLQCQGVITDRSSRDTLKYTYTDPVLQFCTQKAGNMLEVKTLVEGRSVLENGAPYFQDCRMGVSIDWDGIVHKYPNKEPETRNEIDVILMHGTTPLFISCKNGSVDEEELYKLHTVATRFGGPYVKKMLIATNLEQTNTSANRNFIQRAWDMDIFLVADAAELTREEWRNVFKQAMQ